VPGQAAAASVVGSASRTAAPAIDSAAHAGGTGAAIVAAASSQLGGAYVWGGNAPGGFDCSGLTRWAVRQATGQTIPRVAADQARAGQPVARDALRPGDLVFFQNTNQPGISHCGVYLGEGRFVHAASERQGTIVSRLDEPYWAARYATARRFGA
jgi:cell wall-associated NlpC family hydrolase